MSDHQNDNDNGELLESYHRIVRINPRMVRTALEQLPLSMRGPLLASLSALYGWADPERTIRFDTGATRCNGENCATGFATAGARSYLYATLDSGERLLLDDRIPRSGIEAPTSFSEMEEAGVPIVLKAVLAALEPDLVLTHAANVEPLLLRYEGVTVAEAMLDRVRRTEHQGHRLGFVLTYKNGADMAKALWVKIMFVLTMLAQVQSAAAWAVDDEGEEICPVFEGQYSEDPLWLTLLLMVGPFLGYLEAAMSAVLAPVGRVMAMPIVAAITAEHYLSSGNCVRDFGHQGDKVCSHLSAGLKIAAVIVPFIVLPFVAQVIVWLHRWIQTIRWRRTYYGALRVLRGTLKLPMEAMKRLRWWWKMFTDGVIPRIAELAPHAYPRVNFGKEVNEMAMGGSVFGPTTLVSGMAVVLVRNDDDLVYDHVGFAFRCRDYLIMPQHVWGKAQTTPGTTCISRVKEGKKSMEVDLLGSFELLEEHCCSDELERKLDCDGFAFTYDVAIFRLNPQIFSRLSMKSLALTDAPYGAPVDTFGYFPPCVLRASGTVVKSEEATKIYYTASTRDGSSGCPVMMGKKCVGMHQGVNAYKSNRGLASCIIDLAIKVLDETRDETSGNVYHDKVTGVYRDRQGRQVEVETSDFGATLIDSRGKRVALRRDQLLDFESIRQELDEQMLGYRFEAATAPLRVIVGAPSGSMVEHDDVCEVEQAPIAKSPVIRRDTTYLQGVPFTEARERERAVNAPVFKGRDPKVVALLDKVEAKALGYEEGAFDFPSSADNRELTFTSFKKHVAKLKESYANAVAPPADVRRAARKHVYGKMLSAAYNMRRDPLSDPNVSAIINSTLVKGDKSPGRFFMTNGMMTNEAVLGRYSNEVLAQMVRNLGETPEDINVFLKLEPTKKAKLDEGFPRLISGVDLRETIRAHCYFAEFNMALSRSYKKTPLAIGWSPIKVADGEWFYKKYKNSKRFMASDVKNFDWTYQKWAIEDVASIVVQLARPVNGMPQKEVDEWREGAYETILRQFKMPFVLPDGRRVLRNEEIVLSSGSVLTLAMNSLMMFYLDSCAKLEMSPGESGKPYQIDDLGSRFIVTFGGDDGLQTVPAGFSVKDYASRLAGYGLQVHELELRDSIDGSEFFSWRFGKDSRGSPTWVPTRFTKHCESLIATPYSDLPDALVSHMRNWAHDADRFNFFLSIYQKCSMQDPDNFPIGILTRQDILEDLCGLESASLTE